MITATEKEAIWTEIPPSDELTGEEVFYMSEEEYLELIENHEDRFQYENGRVTLMPYAQKNHNIIEANAIIQIGVALEDTPHIVSTNETLVYIPTFSLYANPDVVVFQEPTQYRERRKGVQALLNPICLIEILSPSTESYDRGKKLRMYQSIPSLQQYVMVSQDEVLVESLLRSTYEDEWIYRSVTGLEKDISILGKKISLAKLYAKVQFEEAKK
jgi:Uma2 family endonuclease